MFDSISGFLKTFRQLPVKVINTVDLVVKVDCEGDSVQTLITNTATKTSRMKGLAHRLKELKTNIKKIWHCLIIYST